MNKKFKYLCVSFGAIYSTYVGYRVPNIADGVIVLSILALVGFLFYLESKLSYASTSEDTEILKMEKDLRMEQLRIQAEEVKFHAAQQQARRDESSVNGNTLTRNGFSF